MSKNLKQAKPSKKSEPKALNKKQSFKITLVSAGVILLLLGVGVIGYYFYDRQYEDKIFPNVFIDSHKVAGQSYMETFEILEEMQQNFYDNGLTFKYEDKEVTVPSTVVKDETSGVSVDILNIDIASTADNAYAIARSGDRQQNFWQRMKLLVSPQTVELTYTLNADALSAMLDEDFSEFEDPAQNAQLSFDANGEIEVSEESSGQAFNWEKVLEQVNNNILDWDNQTTVLELEDDEPKLNKADTDPLVEQVQEVLTLAPLKLKWEEEAWEVSETELQDWLAFDDTGVSLHTDNVTTYLDELAEDDIDQPVKEGKFALKFNDDFEVIDIEQFQEGEDGLELDAEASMATITDNWINNKESKAKLTVNVAQPKATPDNIQELGIRELLGVGHTNFSGSPYNRIQNITKGAEILNGLLIAPGETFSLVTALGHIDGASGWLSELVIKENRTIPEFGGGLCQIGTTTFRAAMMSGLEIVERRNHSYVVSYYNYKGKPGVDATIYEPKPDMRFKNDTDHYILWRSRIEGADIYFEFWGTSDGRNGYFTEPVNYNWKSAPEPVITEVDDLEPGVKVCEEKAHNGVSASFDYIIERPDDSEDKETFTSVYKALPAICNKGKEKPEEEKKEESTEEPAQETEEKTVDEEKQDTTKEDTKKKDNDKKKSDKKKKQS